MKLTTSEKQSIAKRFRKFRRDNFLTQAEMATHIGVQRSQISLIENGHNVPRRSTMRRLALLESRAKQSNFLKQKGVNSSYAGKDARKTSFGK